MEATEIPDPFILSELAQSHSTHENKSYYPLLNHENIKIVAKYQKKIIELTWIPAHKEIQLPKQ